MTIKQTINVIRAMGMVCTWRAHVREFRVNGPQGTEATAYYTNDGPDAIATARAMQNQLAGVGGR